MSSRSRPTVFPTIANYRLHDLLSGFRKVCSGPNGFAHSARQMFSTSGNVVEINDVLVMDCRFKPIELKDFDIPLHDIDGEMIRKMEIDGVKHLSPADEVIISASNPTTTMNGIVLANNYRVFVRAVMTAKGKSMNVFMLVDTTSPYTFLAEETIKALGVTLYGPPGDQEGFVGINGYIGERVYVSKAGFKDVNVLGANFLSSCDLHVDYLKWTARITIEPLYV